MHVLRWLASNWAQDTVRSHSARRRRINDLKVAGSAAEVGQVFASIADPEVYGGYGKITEWQAGQALAQNPNLEAFVREAHAGQWL